MQIPSTIAISIVSNLVSNCNLTKIGSSIYNKSITIKIEDLMLKVGNPNLRSEEGTRRRVRILATDSMVVYYIAILLPRLLEISKTKRGARPWYGGGSPVSDLICCGYVVVCYDRGRAWSGTRGEEQEAWGREKWCEWGRRR